MYIRIIFQLAIPTWQMSAITFDSWFKWIAFKNVKWINESHLRWKVAFLINITYLNW